MTDDHETEMPSSPDAERSIISSILQGGSEVIRGLRGALTEDHFYNNQHKRLFNIISAMIEDGKPMDFTVATEYAKQAGLFDAVGGAFGLSEVFSPFGGVGHFEEYLRILEHKRSLRRLYVGLVSASKQTLECDADPLSVASSASSLCRDVIATHQAKEKTMEECLDEWEEAWTQTYHGDRPSCHPSRWPSFNDKCYGIRAGYTVVSGPRASGKSTFAYNMMTDYCVHGGNAGLIKNYEMPTIMTINRLLADIGGIPGGYLFAPDVTKPGAEVQRAITKARAKLASSKLRVIHDVTMGIEAVVEEARRMHANHGKCALLLDYIQIAPDPKGKRKESNREQDVARNSAMLRSISKELDIPTIVLSQLNRDGTTRESTAIENDADDIYRIEKEDGVFIHKQRNGPQEEYLPLFLNGKYFRFEQRV